MAVIKKSKKSENGVKESLSQDNSGKYQLVTKTNTPDGARYYKTISPSESAARNRNMFNVRTNSADSVRAKDVHPLDMKKLSEMKKGGKVAKNGGKSPAWQRKEGKSEAGGLNAKGVASYRRANPGSKLKMAVTTKPSKLKPGSKAAGRRKSFCSRMSGMKKKLTSAKTANDPNSRINKSLRKWNC